MTTTHAPRVGASIARDIVGAAFAISALGTAAATVTNGRVAPSPHIHVNQVGFDPREPKAAVVVGDGGTGAFAVVTADRGDTVFAGTLAAARTWTPSNEVARLAEFGAVVRPGRYVLTVAGVGTSDPFTVRPAAAREVARAAIKAFYFQRASTDLPAQYAGRWARAAGHPDTAVLVHSSAIGPTRTAGEHISSPRGWYDAGDYNKYVVNSGISTYTLFAIADHYPAYAAALDTHIPESGNGLPDVLNEALWNLGWMRTMQDPADGGVYHKLTNAVFDPFVMPAAATTPRYVVQKSTAAALDFAATAAHAALVLRRFPAAPAGLADSLVREALAAWTWARRHPDATYDQDRMNAQFAPRVLTGTYGDGDVRDEFRWAASELYVVTRADSLLVAAAPL
ncbi:MAG TPA: glycoside hydrolase family 9 protein, partial [Gemmatirosa sp.]